MRGFIVTWLTILGATCGLYATASAVGIPSQPLALSPVMTRYPIYQHADMLVDEMIGEDPAAVIAHPERYAFVPLAQESHLRFSRGRIWLRFTVDNTTGRGLPVVLINDFPMLDMLLVEGQEPAAVQRGGILHTGKENIHSVYSGFAYTVRPGRTTYYLGVRPGVHPVFLSFQLWSDAAFKGHEVRRLAFLTLLFGALLSLLVYNGLFAVTTRSRLYACYCLGLVGMTSVQFVITGMHTLLPAGMAVLVALSWPFALGLTFVGIFWFVGEFYRVNESPRRVVQLFNGFVGVCLLFPFAYLVHPKLAASVFFVIAAAAIAGIALFAVFKERQRSKTEVSFVVGGMPLFITAALWMLVALGAIPYLPIYNDLLFGAVVLQELLLSIVMGTASQRDVAARAKIQESMALGRSVQDLLLPAKVAGHCGTFDYLFVYRPFEGLMSGDWINWWQTSDGTHHFVIGDVVGKGPQAALAVAAIAATIKRCVRDDLPVDKALHNINTSLHDVFAGAVTSTFSAVKIDKQHAVSLYNGGGRGWYAFDGETLRHQTLRTPLLGLSDKWHLAEITLHLGHGGAIFAYTDGLCDGPVASKRLAVQLTALLRAEADLNAVAQAGLRFYQPHLIKDDRTMLILQRPRVDHDLGEFDETGWGNQRRAAG